MDQHGDRPEHLHAVLSQDLDDEVRTTAETLIERGLAIRPIAPGDDTSELLAPAAGILDRLLDDLTTRLPVPASSGRTLRGYATLSVQPLDDDGSPPRREVCGSCGGVTSAPARFLLEIATTSRYSTDLDGLIWVYADGASLLVAVDVDDRSVTTALAGLDRVGGEISGLAKQRGKAPITTSLSYRQDGFRL